MAGSCIRAWVTWTMCRTLFDLSVASTVESVPGRTAVALSGGCRDRCCAAPAGELRLGAEPCRVADLGEHCHRGDDPDPDQCGEGAAQGIEQVRDEV